MAGINQFFVPAKLPNISPFFQLPYEQLQKYMETQQLKQDYNKANLAEGIATTFDYIPVGHIAENAANIYQDILNKADKILEQSKTGDLRNMTSDIYNFRKELQSRMSNPEGDIYKHIVNYNAFKNASEQYSALRQKPGEGKMFTENWMNVLLNKSISDLNATYDPSNFNPGNYSAPAPNQLDLEAKIETYIDGLHSSGQISDNDYLDWKKYYIYNVRTERSGVAIDKINEILNHKLQADPEIHDMLRQGYEYGIPGYRVYNEDGTVNDKATQENLSTFYVRNKNGGLDFNASHPFFHQLAGSAIEHSYWNTLDKTSLTGDELGYKMDQEAAAYPASVQTGITYTDPAQAQQDYQAAVAAYNLTLESGTPEQQAAALEKLQQVAQNAGYSDINKYILQNTNVTKESDPDLYNSLNKMSNELTLSQKDVAAIHSGGVDVNGSPIGGYNASVLIPMYLQKKLGSEIAKVKKQDGTKLTAKELYDAMTAVSGVVDNAGGPAMIDLSAAVGYLKSKGYKFENPKFFGIDNPLVGKSQLEVSMEGVMNTLSVTSGGPGTRKTEEMLNAPGSVSQSERTGSTIPKNQQGLYNNKRTFTTFNNAVSDYPEDWDVDNLPQPGDSWTQMIQKLQDNGVTINEGEVEATSQADGYITYNLPWSSGDGKSKKTGILTVVTKEKQSSPNSKQYNSPGATSTIKAFDKQIQDQISIGNINGANALQQTKELAVVYTASPYEVQASIENIAPKLNETIQNVKQRGGTSGVFTSDDPILKGYQFKFIKNTYGEWDIYIKDPKSTYKLATESGAINSSQVINPEILSGLLYNAAQK